MVPKIWLLEIDFLNFFNEGCICFCCITYLKLFNQLCLFIPEAEPKKAEKVTKVIKKEAAPVLKKEQLDVTKAGNKLSQNRLRVF